MWAGLGIVFLAAVVLYGVYTFVEAKSVVAQTPRVDMMLCDTHGPIPKKRILKLDFAGGKPIEMCPLCYHERVRAAEKRK